MKILHTSDWHLGRTLYGRKRYGEFAAFLSWLLDTMQKEKSELLIVAGDIFDNSTPSNRAQQLYYQFLKNVSTTGCQHVVIIGGNHDSPSLLEAPKELLKFFQVHVVGSIPSELEQEVITLRSEDGRDQLIVCAVPYLRDRDIRRARAGESIETKNSNLLQAIADHYTAIIEIARKRQELSPDKPPIIATGHLFTAGGHLGDGDGVRDLYVGSLAHVDVSVFPDDISYLALGHLHRAQKAGGNSNMRYCGSPLPMTFTEAGSKKCVLSVELIGGKPEIAPITIPLFQQLHSIRGKIAHIVEQISALKEYQQDIWLEIVYEGKSSGSELQQQLHQAIGDSSLEVLRIINTRVVAEALQRSSSTESLELLTEAEVFRRCLVSREVPEDERPQLLKTFQETLLAIEDDDSNIE